MQLKQFVFVQITNKTIVLKYYKLNDFFLYVFDFLWKIINAKIKYKLLKRN